MTFGQTLYDCGFLFIRFISDQYGQVTFLSVSDEEKVVVSGEIGERYAHMARNTVLVEPMVPLDDKISIFVRLGAKHKKPTLVHHQHAANVTISTVSLGEIRQLFEIEILPKMKRWKKHCKGLIVKVDAFLVEGKWIIDDVSFVPTSKTYLKKDCGVVKCIGEAYHDYIVQHHTAWI